MTFKYLVYGKEVGESGTPHLQGTVQYKSAKDAKLVKKEFPIRTHLELCRSLFDSIKYCKKDGDWVEFGDVPSDGGKEGREYWQQQLDHAREHGEFEDPKLQVTHPRVAEYHKQKRLREAEAETLAELNNVWIVGKTGVGKSHYVREHYPVHYEKPLSKWWDGYKYQDVVYIDEIDVSHASWIGYFLKKWADKWPFQAEIKNSHLGMIRPKVIVVTSNYEPRDLWADERMVDPILRRFKIIRL